MLRLALVATTSVPFLLSACSGANDTGLFGGATTEGSPTDPTPPITSADPTTAPTTTPTTTPDAGEPETGSDASPPDETCTQEVEPDDNFDRATPFTARFCGQLSSATDVDFGQFVVPQGAKSLSITHAETGGKVAYRYYKNGVLLPITAEIAATPGIVYGVSIRLAAGSKTDTPIYKLNVAFAYQ